MIFPISSPRAQHESFPQFSEDLELLENNDAEKLQQVEKSDRSQKKLNITDIEENDDLQSLKNDIGDYESIPGASEGSSAVAPLNTSAEEGGEQGDKESPGDKMAEAGGEGKTPNIFDIGEEERKLLEISKYVEGKIPESEWDEIAARAKTDKYVIQRGDWLWKISKKLFGSGFYYAKIWSINPYIHNPHEIEPGMTLVFDTGSADSPPKVELGEFDEGIPAGGESAMAKRERGHQIDFDQFGDQTEPPWLKERKKLMDQGIYFQ
ncbi:MAG: LysM peptidoglycan-binding domain-containing protein, partial [Pseudomonadota bacterium]